MRRPFPTSTCRRLWTSGGPAASLNRKRRPPVLSPPPPSRSSHPLRKCRQPILLGSRREGILHSLKTPNAGSWASRRPSHGAHGRARVKLSQTRGWQSPPQKCSVSAVRIHTSIRTYASGWRVPCLGTWLACMPPPVVGGDSISLGLFFTSFGDYTVGVLVAGAWASNRQTDVGFETLLYRRVRDDDL